MEKQETKEQETISLTEILTNLEEGTVNPKSLPYETRSQCIAYFNDRGLTAREIADKFKLSDRHIRRLLSEINRGYALEVDPDWLMERFGEIYNNHRIKCKALQKLIHSEKTSNSEKQKLIALQWRIEREFFQMLISPELLGEHGHSVQNHMYTQTRNWSERERAKEEKEKSRKRESIEPEAALNESGKASNDNNVSVMDVVEGGKIFRKLLEEAEKNKQQKKLEASENGNGQDMPQKTQVSN